MNGDARPTAGSVTYLDAVEMYVKRANLRCSLYPPQPEGGLHDGALRELKAMGRVAWVPGGPTWLGGWHWVGRGGSNELTQGSSTETV